MKKLLFFAVCLGILAGTTSCAQKTCPTYAKKQTTHAQQ